MVRTLLGVEAISLYICSFRDAIGQSLLHCAALILGDQYMRSPQVFSAHLNGLRISPEEGCQELTVLLKLIQELLIGGWGMHVTAETYYTTKTPLLRIIDAIGIITRYTVLHKKSPQTQIRQKQDCTRPWSVEENLHSISQLSIPMMVWLKALKYSGIDLSACGRQKKDILFGDTYRRGLALVSRVKRTIQHRIS